MTSPDARINKYLPLVLALLGVAAGLAWLFFLNHRFFFMDDRQAQYFPYGLVIKEQLLKGEFPFVTTRTFYGSALWLDWQYGIYNPLSLLMDLMIMPQHLELSGFLFALVSNLLLTFAAYVLGRAYGLKRDWAALMGLLLGLNIYIIYRGANIWHPGVTSLAWLLLSWAALKKLLTADRRIAGHTLVVALLVYLMISAGWPHCDVAFAIIAGALFVETWLAERRRACRMIPAGLLSAAVSLPVVLPPLLAFSWTSRGAVPPNTLFHPAIFDFANLSNPAWWPFMTDGQPGPQPMLYLAWFALPFLFLVDWGKLRRGHLLLLAALMEMFFIFAAGGIGPALLLRYPIRWIPYLFVPALLALLIVLQEEQWVFTRANIRRSLWVCIVPVLAGFALHPRLPWAAWAAALLCILSLGFTAAQAKFGKLRQLPGFLGVSSMLIFMLVFLAFPANPDAVDWGKADRTPVSSVPNPSVASYTIATAADILIPKGTLDEREFPSGAMGAYYHIDTINGYSSIGQKGLEKVLHCTEYSFVLCTYPPQALLQREPETGASYLDLFKVGRILAETGPLSRHMEASIPRGWAEHAQQKTMLFERRKISDLPGNFVVAITVLDRSAPSSLDGNGETFRVKSTNRPGLLVFARLFYPGFRAQLGATPLKVRPLNDVLVSVEIPPGSSGTFRLSFLPPGFAFFAAVAFLSLAICAGLALTEMKNA